VTTARKRGRGSWTGQDVSDVVPEVQAQVASEIPLGGTAGDFSSLLYWQQAYSSKCFGETCEWYVSFSELSAIFTRWVPRTGTVVDVGCGNSRLTQVMASQGWRTLGVDACPNAVAALATSAARGSCTYFVGTCCALPSLDETLCGVVDKGLLDCLSCGLDGVKAVYNYKNEAVRCLRAGGVFVVISVQDSQAISQALHHPMLEVAHSETLASAKTGALVNCLVFRKREQPQAVAGSPEYWEAAFQDKEYGEIFEWYGIDFGCLQPQLSKYLPFHGTLHHVGCGNSSLPEEMYDHGWHNIVNSDISPSVIEHMRARNELTRPRMRWEVSGCGDSGLESGSAHGVIDKGVLDALVCGSLEEEIDRYKLEVVRVLRIGGYWCVISHGDPHDRKARLQHPVLSLVHTEPVAHGGERTATIYWWERKRQSCITWTALNTVSEAELAFRATAVAEHSIHAIIRVLTSMRLAGGRRVLVGSCEGLHHQLLCDQWRTETVRMSDPAESDYLNLWHFLDCSVDLVVVQDAAFVVLEAGRQSALHTFLSEVIRVLRVGAVAVIVFPDDRLALWEGWARLAVTVRSVPIQVCGTAVGHAVVVQRTDGNARAMVDVECPGTVPRLVELGGGSSDPILESAAQIHVHRGRCLIIGRATVALPECAVTRLLSAADARSWSSVPGETLVVAPSYSSDDLDDVLMPARFDSAIESQVFDSACLAGHADFFVHSAARTLVDGGVLLSAAASATAVSAAKALFGVEDSGAVLICRKRTRRGRVIVRQDSPLTAAPESDPESTAEGASSSPPWDSQYLAHPGSQAAKEPAQICLAAPVWRPGDSTSWPQPPGTKPFFDAALQRWVGDIHAVLADVVRRRAPAGGKLLILGATFAWHSLPGFQTTSVLSDRSPRQCDVTSFVEALERFYDTVDVIVEGGVFDQLRLEDEFPRLVSLIASKLRFQGVFVSVSPSPCGDARNHFIQDRDEGLLVCIRI